VRTFTAFALAALSTLSACGNGGDACRQLCDELEACGGGSSDDCYDNYSVTLSLPTTRALQLSQCNDALDAMGSCDTTDTDL
jgi:hypothetical protein